ASTDTTVAATLPDGPGLDGRTTDVTFAIVSPSRVAGQVFEDVDGDGRRGAGELGLDGRLMELVDADSGVIVATTVTASVDLDGSGAIDPATESGIYEFAGLDAGRYDVRQVLPVGWWQSAPTNASRVFAAVGVGTDEMLIYELDPISGVIRNTFDAPQPVTLTMFQGFAAGPDVLYYVDSNGQDADPEIFVLDPDTGAVLAVQTVVGETPSELVGAAYLDGLLYLQFQSHEVVVWDPATGAAVDRFTLDRDVAALTADDTGGMLYGAAEGNAIVVIDPVSGAIVQTIPLSEEIAMVGGLGFANGVLLVAPNIEENNTIFRVDPATGAVLGSFPVIDGPVCGLAADGARDADVWVYRVDLGWGEDAFGQDFGARAADLFGDLNLDGQVNVADIDLLCAGFGAAGAYPPGCDLDGDNDVDADDLGVLVRDVLGTELGDLNLDGCVNATDLAIMKAHYGQAGAGWAGGDLNADGLVNLTDLAIMRTTFGFLAPPAGGSGAPVASTSAAPTAPEADGLSADETLLVSAPVKLGPAIRNDPQAQDESQVVADVDLSDSADPVVAPTVGEPAPVIQPSESLLQPLAASVLEAPLETVDALSGIEPILAV
ncbi:MAG: glutaminyl-peptide cyclotransferase, partial [Planctomycetota bacterium]